MNNHDKELFEKVMSNKDKYRIEVDNDVIYVIDKSLEDNEDYDCESFSEYGYHLLLEIFQFLGLDAEYV